MVERGGEWSQVTKVQLKKAVVATQKLKQRSVQGPQQNKTEGGVRSPKKKGEGYNDKY